MIDFLAGRLAFKIKQANPEQTASVEVMKFSLIIVLNAFSIVALSLMIGAASGKFAETALTLFSFALLKFFSGGSHLKSSGQCVLWSTAAMTILPHIPVNLHWMLGLTSASLLLVAVFAPSKIQQKKRIPEKYNPVLKIISILIVASNFLLFSDVMAKAFFLQSLTLIRKRR